MITPPRFNGSCRVVPPARWLPPTSRLAHVPQLLRRLGVVALAILATAAATRSAADTIRIGISAPLTGIQAASGKDVVDHLQAGITELRARGDFGEHKVELIALDDGYDVNRTVANVRTLVADKRVQLVLNQIGSAHAAAIVPVLQASGVTLFAPLSGPRNLYDDSLRPTVVPLRASYADEVRQQIRTLAATGVDRVSLVYQDDAFGQDILRAWQDFAAESSLKLTSVHPVARGSQAIEAPVDAALNAGAGAVVLALVSTPALAATNQIRRKAGNRVYAMLMSVAVTSEVIAGLATGESRGAVLFSSVMPIPTGGGSRLLKAYADFRKKYDLKPSFRGLEAYVSMQIVAAELRKLTRVTPQSLGASLAQASGFSVADLYMPTRNSARYADVFAITKHGLL